MKKRKSGDGLRSLSYMAVSLGLFFLSLAVTVFLLIRSVLTEGNLSKAESILGTAALAASIAGFVIALYGHFIVRIDGKGDWRIGAALNGLMMLFLVFVYFLGVS